MRLAKGIYKPIKRPDRAWWTKGWEYWVAGVLVARIYKQVYPRDTKFIYRYMLNGLNMLPATWKSSNEYEITSDHYTSKKEATKAIKKSIKKYIIILCSMIKPQ